MINVRDGWSDCCILNTEDINFTMMNDICINKLVLYVLPLLYINKYGNTDAIMLQTFPPSVI